MSDLVHWMENVYTRAKNNDFEWKPVYPNNMIQNGIVGIYTDMFFEEEGKYKYLKYTIEYQPRCDSEGMSHPEEGTAFYILHELRLLDLEEKFEIPEPGENFEWNDTLPKLVNKYGRFRYAFLDEDTAKKVVSNELMMWIYPFRYILSEQEIEEWNSFIKNYE